MLFCNQVFFVGSGRKNGMPHDVMVSWDLISYQYKALIENALKEFQKENNLSLELWYHDTTVCFISRNEKPFVRLLQISIDQDEDGMFVEVIPEIYREDEKKGVRHVCEVIPSLLLRRAPLLVAQLTPESGKEFASNLRNELSVAWENTYYITPDMLTNEIKMSPLSSK